MIDINELADCLIDGLDFLRSEDNAGDLIKGYHFAWLKIGDLVKREIGPADRTKLYRLLEENGWFKQ